MQSGQVSGRFTESLTATDTVNEFALESLQLQVTKEPDPPGSGSTASSK